MNHLICGPHLPSSYHRTYVLIIYSYVDGLQLDKRHATNGGSPTPVEDFNSLREAAGAKQGARDWNS
jgi:hypothetical protein